MWVTYYFTTKEKFSKAWCRLCKTGKCVELFVNNGYAIDYKKNRRIG